MWSVKVLLASASLFCSLASAHVNIDGGRSDLPGMKRDMFDQAQRSKKSGGAAPKKGPPDCPKSDKMSPFVGLAFVNGDLYVKLNSTEEPCQKLLMVGGANYTILSNASRTCGPVGEWKRRIAEELSAVFFQGGLEWVRHEGESIEVVTEEGTFEVEVNEEKYKTMEECWARSCGCEQAKNPMGKGILAALAVIGLGGLLSDSLKLSWKKFKGEKPSKHVQCKKGHKVEEVKYAARNYCNLCSKMGTSYQCNGDKCDYDLCKICYKAAKKKVKATLEAWYDKHPEEKKKEEEKKKDKKKNKTDASDDEEGSNKDGNTNSEAESTTKAESSKPDDEEEEANDTSPKTQD